MEDREQAQTEGQERTSALLRRLENAGCRTKDALERVFGDEEFYAEMLTEFLEDPALGELQSAMEEKNAKKAFAAAHTLRGAALTLGLLPVGMPAAGLTELLRGTDEMPYAAREIYAGLTEGLEAIRGAVEAG